MQSPFFKQVFAMLLAKSESPAGMLGKLFPVRLALNESIAEGAKFSLEMSKEGYGFNTSGIYVNTAIPDYQPTEIDTCIAIGLFLLEHAESQLMSFRVTKFCETLEAMIAEGKVKLTPDDVISEPLFAMIMNETSVTVVEQQGSNVPEGATIQ